MYFIDLIIILIIFFIKLITDFKRFLNFKYINYKIFKFEEFVNSNKYDKDWWREIESHCKVFD